MGENLINNTMTVLIAVVGLATVAVLVSKNANTGTILTSGGTAFSGILNAATNPYSGSSGGLSVPSVPSFTPQ